MPDAIKNHTVYTDRSLRSLFAWAWRQVRPGLTARQCDDANYDGAVFDVTCGLESAQVWSQEVALGRRPEHFGSAATAFWRFRAGLKYPWADADSAGKDAPALVKYAAREPRPKPEHDARHEALRLADRKVEGKREHLAKLRKKKRSAEAAARTAEKRIASATIELAKFEREAEAARGRMISAAETTSLSTDEYAVRMRAKRNANTASSAAR